MADLTSASAIITITATGVFNLPQQLQGFGADDVYDVPAIVAGEKSMGVDGFLSAGFVFVDTPQDFTLQADSPSNVVFDQIYRYESTNRTKVVLQGVTIIPAVGLKWVAARGFLMSYSPAPAAGKILKPRKYNIAWERLVPQPA